MTSAEHPARFVVLRHEVGKELARTARAHFDWMFESGSALRTWATPIIDDLNESFETEAERLVDHRIAYLEYEGEIDGGRGCVVAVIRGACRVISNESNRFVAELCWQQGDVDRHAVIACYRSLPADGRRRDESREFWRLRFSPGRYETNR